jgi:hypothetical protein
MSEGINYKKKIGKKMGWTHGQGCIYFVSDFFFFFFFYNLFRG